MLRVHNDSQLEVLIPLSSQSDFTYDSIQFVVNSLPIYSIMTRFKSGALEKKNYTTLLATFSELKTLQLTENEPFICGYSFIYEMIDST